VTRDQLVRAVATVGLVAFWALATLGGQFDITLPGILNDLWYSAGRIVAIVSLGLVVGILVGRWWILLAAATPVAVYAGLQLAGHVAPWHDSGPPLTDFWVYGGLLWLALFYVVPLGVGVLVRKGVMTPPPTRDLPVR
jgi:hypothetical protein